MFEWFFGIAAIFALCVALMALVTAGPLGFHIVPLCMLTAVLSIFGYVLEILTDEA